MCIVDCTLVKVGYDMISGKGMPTSRRQSVLIPLYKEKVIQPNAPAAEA